MKLREVPMGKFDGILFCSDIDGTLLNSEGLISEGNKAAIKYFQDNGGAFTACTGRHPNVVKYALSEIKINAPIISYNGAIIYDHDAGETVRLMPLSDETILDCIRFVDKDRDIIDLVLSARNDSIYFAVDRENGGYFAPDGKAKGARFSTPEECFESLPKENLYKALFRVVPSGSERVRDAAIEFFADNEVSRSWIRGVEVNHWEGTKGPSSRYLAQKMGKRLLVCAGDYENDLSMIRDADIGFAMENGVDEVKSVADVIAPNCSADGIKWIIEYLEKEIDCGGIKL